MVKKLFHFAISTVWMPYYGYFHESKYVMELLSKETNKTWNENLELYKNHREVFNLFSYVYWVSGVKDFEQFLSDKYVYINVHLKISNVLKEIEHELFENLIQTLETGKMRFKRLEIRQAPDDVFV